MSSILCLLQAVRLCPAATAQPSLACTLPSPSLQRLQAEGGSGGQQYVGVLWQFLRMRQACNHPLLVKGAGHAHELAAAEVSAGCDVAWHLGLWLHTHACVLASSEGATPLLAARLPRQPARRVPPHVGRPAY